MVERFNELYYLYNKDLYRVVYSYLLNVSDSEDVLQKVFIKLYKNKKILSLSNEEVKKWLLRVGINEAKDILKSSWKKLFTKLETKTIASTNKNNDLLEDSLNNISPDYRIPLYLFYYEGYSIKEIAILMKRSESAIKMRLTRGKEKLKREMGKAQ